MSAELLLPMGASICTTLSPLRSAAATEYPMVKAYKYLSPIAIILSIATLLRLYQLGTESLWIDEFFSIRDALFLNLNTRPLYYLLLHIWIWFGGTDADAWLRLLSVPFSVAAIWLTYDLAQKVASQRAAYLAALMTTVSPLFIGYGQEIRMYALGLFLTLLGTKILLSFLDTPTRFKVVGWTVLRWLAILTTPLNILLLVPDGLICAWQFRRHLRWVWMIGVGMGFIGVATVPSALVLKSRGPEFMASWVLYQPKPGLRQIGGMLTEFTMFWPFSDLPNAEELVLSFRPIDLPTVMLLYYVLATVVISGVLAWGILHAVAIWRQSASPALIWLIAWGGVPTMIMLGISYLSSTIWFPRYLLFVAPYVIIVLAATFEHIWRNFRRVAIAIAAVYLIGVGLGLHHHYTVLNHDDWKGIAQAIQIGQKPDDVIGLYPRHWDPEYTLPRYYRGGRPIYLLAEETDLSTPVPEGTESTFVAAMLDRLPPTEGRYWLVVYYPQPRVIEALNNAIAERYTLISAEQFPNSVNDDLRLYLLEP